MEERKKFVGTIIVLALMLISLPVRPAYAATLIVTSTDDTTDPGTLRYAVANASPGDTIEFDLTYPALIELESTLTITQPLTITGPGQDNLTIDGSKNLIFNINAAVDFAISASRRICAASLSGGSETAPIAARRADSAFSRASVSGGAMVIK